LIISKIIKIIATRSRFKAKMHQIWLLVFVRLSVCVLDGVWHLLVEDRTHFKRAQIWWYMMIAFVGQLSSTK